MDFFVTDGVGEMQRISHYVHWVYPIFSPVRDPNSFLVSSSTRKIWQAKNAVQELRSSPVKFCLMSPFVLSVKVCQGKYICLRALHCIQRTQQTLHDVGPMLAWCCVSIADDGLLITDHNVRTWWLGSIPVRVLYTAPWLRQYWANTAWASTKNRRHLLTTCVTGEEMSCNRNWQLHALRSIANEHQTLAQCCFNVVQPSATLAQH